MKNWYVERMGGVVVGITRWPIRANDSPERLSEDHPEVVAFFIGRARLSALAEVKGAAQARIADLDSSITKTTAKAAVLPFKTQFQDAATLPEVEAVRQTAISAINAL